MESIDVDYPLSLFHMSLDVEKGVKEKYFHY